MVTIHNAHFDRPMVIIAQGECHVSRSEIITTVLGSCVAVCIKDTETGLAGMNHFMLPDVKHVEGGSAARSAKYGVVAMRLLLELMMGAGAVRKALVAKVFGGANVLGFAGAVGGSIPQSNIESAEGFLSRHSIPVVRRSVGGRCGRKILFFPETAAVLVKYCEEGP